MTGLGLKSNAWWTVWHGLVSLCNFLLWTMRYMLTIIWLGLPAGVGFAVLAWLMIDWVMPAMDGTHLNFGDIWRLAKSPLQQVKDANPDDLGWAFSARLKVVLLGALFVCLIIGRDIRRLIVIGVRLSFSGRFNWCVGAFLACATIATCLMWNQAGVMRFLAPVPQSGVF